MLRRFLTPSSRAVSSSLRSYVRPSAPMMTSMSTATTALSHNKALSAALSTIRRNFATNKSEDDDVKASGNGTVASTASDFSSIVGSNGGWWAFLGLGGYFLFSKEILLLNEEFLMVSNFITMIVILYLAVGDTALEAVAADQKDDMRRADLISDLQIDLIQAQIKAHEINVAQVDVIKAFKEQYAKLAKDVIQAKNIRARHAAYESVVAKLNSLRERQESEAQQYITKVYDHTVRHVEESWLAADEATKNRYLQWAISVVGGSTEPLQDDPIANSFKSYLESEQYQTDIEEEKRAAADSIRAEQEEFETEEDDEAEGEEETTTEATQRS